MKYLAAISALAFTMLAGQALAQNQGNPVSGLGDAKAQDEPSSVGINNGYNPPIGAYPGVVAPGREGRSGSSRSERRYRD
jgi:hypothetical protein